MNQKTNLLIVGAGPFGLAMAAYAQHLKLDYMIVGKPMGLWRDNMPDGMHLRTTYDWHFDPLHVHTIERYLESQNLTPQDATPIPLQLYLDYAQWFQAEKQIDVLPVMVQQLDHTDDAGGFVALLDNGTTISAQQVVLALGYSYFKNVPEELAEILPAERLAHSCDFVDFASLKDKRVLIIGGRQSAFESAALVHESGASTVHVVHRHDTPAFTESDWSWLYGAVDAMTQDPGWFRNLPAEENRALAQRFVTEGRLKLEPWLGPHLDKASVHLWPKAQVVASEGQDDGTTTIALDNGQEIPVDFILLSTGYKVDMVNVPFLVAGNVLSKLQTDNGFPLLDTRFQSSVPGLYIGSLPAARDFGPFMAFTVSAIPAAKAIGTAIR